MVDTAAVSTLTGAELADIRRANRTGLRPVVLVPGPWLLAGGAASWRDRFEEAGYTTIAPAPADVPDSVEALVDHQREAIRRLDRTPALVGHATGGLVALRLAGEGVSAATVAIDLAPAEGDGRMDVRNPNRGPVLLIAAGTDDATWFTRESYRALSARNRTPVTELVELSGRAHALSTARGRREVADRALRFVQRYA
jgi:alpha-beta hydrolase superfamily lysophospholipase